jgi:hypothetical protein
VHRILAIALLRDLFPAIPFLGVRLKATIDFRDHRYIPMSKLARDQLKWYACASHPDGPVMPAVV